MKVLFLAPQPFFQERGTPIAVRLALQVLSERKEDTIDLLAYQEGDDIAIPQVTLHRIPKLPGLSGIRPGVSLKKLCCDFVYFFKALSLVVSNRGNEKYRMVHAVEEAVFMALVIKWIFGIPYLYDMDSSLAIQLQEKWTWTKFLNPALEWLEKIAIRQSVSVVPVCDALAVVAKQRGADRTHILHDISLLDRSADSNSESIDLHAEASLPSDSKIIVYIGNLERYQGIDLLVEGFALACKDVPRWHVVIIGGAVAHQEAYKERCADLGVSDRVHLVGSRPVSMLNSYLLQADILASPRTLGNNTPMKIYSYLHSGVPVIATRLVTHTQVLNEEVCCLVDPKPESFADGLRRLCGDEVYRAKIGAAARELAEERYTFTRFRKTLNEIYDGLREKLK